MGKADTKILWLDKTFNETMDLLQEAKHYNANVYRRQVRHLVPTTRLEIGAECLRVTSRLSHTMAWLLTEKAILNNELSRSEFKRLYRPLAEEDICTSIKDSVPEDCPNGLINLMERSFELFMRATRLEAMLRDKPQVHNLQGQN